jgi:TRAP-type C4-dicarboxylate transport system substrate-binding protein
MDVLQIPFLFQNYEEVDFTLKRIDPPFRKAIEESGHVLLGWSEVGFIYLMSTVPISSVADLRRAKVWSWEESPMAKAIFDEAGVTAIPLSVPDVLVGLQTGLVDVVYTPPTGAIALQWFTKIKYLTDVPLAYLAAGMIITKEAFQKIPSPSQTILTESCQRHLDQLKGVIRQENQEAIKVMVKQGVKVVTPSKEQIGEFKSLSSKAIEHIRGPSFSKKTLTEVTSALESYRKGVK